jgi:hypothetical protein
VDTFINGVAHRWTLRAEGFKWNGMLHDL